MALNFFNQSRSFDARRNRVQFWGHDGTSEISFLVEGDALKKLDPDLHGEESGFLKAFDAARSTIQNVASAIYRRERHHEHTYVLAAEDF